MAPRQSRRATLSYLTDVLPTAVPPIFEQAQNTTANHRKNIVQLRKIQETCATITQETEKGTKMVGERAFNSVFVDMVNRVLPIKKGVAVADRIVKFVANYVAYTTEQDSESSSEDGMATRFTSKLLRHLLSGMEAKDKNVRFRVTLMTVSLINGLGEIDDDLYQGLRHCLLRRARDKESAVRVQAALGLAKLQSGEDEEDLDEGEESLADVLLDLLRYDPAAEVRRAALYTLPRNQATLPLILARTRDVDPTLRRTVYHGSLSATSLPDARILTIAQREEVVRNGLGDREPNVRKAAAAMLGGWLDQAEGNLLEFLGRFDVVSSEVAEEALLSIFVTRSEVFENLEFGDDWWMTLTPEKAFLGRVFAEYCVANKKDSRIEETMPVVTALAFAIQEAYNKVAAADKENDAEVLQEHAFVVDELLRLAVTLDYADEIGRRRMFQLAREMIAQIQLPERLISRCMDVLHKISNGERDLMRLIVDVVSMMREGDGDEEMTEPPTPRKLGSPSRSARVGASADVEAEGRVSPALIDYRCLLICISLLERINLPLQENSVFHGLLPDLIIPAARHKEEPALRDLGLVCLGLCGLIDENMAADSFRLFVQQKMDPNVDDELKVKVVQGIFDLLMVHKVETVVANTLAVEQLVGFVGHMLKDTGVVQAVACEGIAKLMLAGILDDPTILQSLILLYFSPETADNQALRQCLAYFLPVFCHTSTKNQRLMLSIFADTFVMLSDLGEEFGTTTGLLPLAQMGLMMVDWLDPLKTVGTTPEHGIHLDLGIEILKALLSETNRDVRKTLVSFLGKLTLPDNGEMYAWQTKALYQLIASLKEKRPLSDAAPRNSVTRFEASLVKHYPELEAYDEDAFRAEGADHEATSELFGFIDDVDETPDSPEKPSRRARSTSRVPRGSSVSSVASDSDATPVKRKPAPRRPEPVAEESGEDESASESSSEEDVEDILGSD